MNYILVVIYLIFSTGGLIMIKLGGDSLHLGLKSNIFNITISLISILGYMLYMVSFLLFTKIITQFNLSYIIPLSTGVVQVVIFLAAVFIFKEELSFWPVLGIFLIIVGVILLNVKQA